VRTAKAYLSLMVIAALAAALAGAAQAAPVTARPMQQATKTAASMYVAYATKATAANKMAFDVPQALQELWTTCVEGGLHPAGPSIVAAQTEGQEGQTIKWEAWLPLADQPSDDDLANRGPVPIKQVPQTDVAFTYHAGEMATVQDTFITLVGWAVGRGLNTGDRARIVISVWPMDSKPEHLVAECQLELAAPATGLAK
jgi:hypothetical protein